MTNEERQQQAANKILKLFQGGLDGVVQFRVINMAVPESQFGMDDQRNQHLVIAFCFPLELWDFDGKRLIRRSPSK